MEQYTERLGLRSDQGSQIQAGGDAGEAATGEPRVDAALARLDELAGRPVTEHHGIFEDVHRRLRDVLGELDAGEPHAHGQAGAAGAEPQAGR